MGEKHSYQAYLLELLIEVVHPITKEVVRGKEKREVYADSPEAAVKKVKKQEKKIAANLVGFGPEMEEPQVLDFVVCPI